MPPKLFLKFFRWFCHPRLREHIEGDLLEEFNERLLMSGRRKASFHFAVDVLLLFRPGIVRPFGDRQQLNTYGMYKNYLKVGLRNLLRHKGYSLINIGGLAIGMTVAILNALWIWHELSFNKSFENYDRIAQVSEIGLDLERGGHWLGTTMTYPLGNALRTDYASNFKRVARTSWILDPVLAFGETKTSSLGLYVDNEFPEMFSLKMTTGSRGALKDGKSILLSASLARTLFGNEDPIGKIVLVDNSFEMAVGGVFEDIPSNTNFDGMKFFMPWQQFLATNKWIEERALTDWRNHFIKIYGEIKEGQSFEKLAEQIKPALQIDPKDKEKFEKAEQHLSLYPMKEWHLHPPGLRQGQFEPVVMLKLVGSIGIFVLILACINFMNLTTARSEKRAREVGIRKTIGSIRSQLIQQFFSESLLVVLFAFVIALGLTSTFLPAFNEIAAKNVAMPWANGWFWIGGLAFVLVTAILASSYPAFYLSSFSPVKVLKGTFKAGPSAVVPRKVLVVFQFSISVILILATVVVYQQINHAKNRGVGYDREGLLMMRKRSSAFEGKYETLRAELKNTNMVVEVSESMGPMTEIVSGNSGWDWEGRNPNSDPNFATLAVSHTHGKTAGWKFTMGRDFDVDNPSDSSSVVINESALKLMNLKDPIGQPVSWTWWRNNAKMDYKIIGVVEDMVMNSPYAPTEPTIFYLKGFNGTPSWLNIRVNPQVSMHEALPVIEATFRKVIPTVPFEYIFADEAYAKKFGKEERIGNLAMIFSVLAVFISCLGLLGLASFMAEQRTKEVGIRKVLGASVADLWRILSKDFVLLVMIACLISIPVSFILLSKWLEKFSYRTELSAATVLTTAIGAIVLSLAMVSYQAIRAAVMNPVKNLRSE